MNKQIEKIWEEIESWNEIHIHPTLGSYLNDPASDNVISDLNK